MAATLTAERFSGPEWMFGRKLDEIRRCERPIEQRLEALARREQP
jgi:hypothetical protein